MLRCYDFGPFYSSYITEIFPLTVVSNFLLSVCHNEFMLPVTMSNVAFFNFATAC